MSGFKLVVKRLCLQTSEHMAGLSEWLGTRWQCEGWGFLYRGVCQTAWGDMHELQTEHGSLVFEQPTRLGGVWINTFI